MSRAVQNITSTYNSFKLSFMSRVPTVKFPEKLKGTVVEKWKDYWAQVLTDYKEVGAETLKFAKNEPARTSALLSLFGLATYCFKTNPDETSYRDAVINYSSEVMLVGPTIRNPAAKKYLEEIESLYNEGLVRRQSLGLFSVMWKDNYNENVSLYKAQCTYLQVPFYKFHEQIIDVGFMNKWHILSRRMIDYDINPDEWVS